MRNPYPSDQTDVQWAIIEPLSPVKKTGRPRQVDMKEILNAIFYIDLAGCQWDMLPHDLPAKITVYDHFALCPDDGTWDRIKDALIRRVPMAAEHAPPPLGSPRSTARRSRGARLGARGATTAARRSSG